MASVPSQIRLQRKPARPYTESLSELQEDRGASARRVNCLMKGIVDTDRNPAIEKIVNFPGGVIHDSH